MSSPAKRNPHAPTTPGSAAGGPAATASTLRGFLQPTGDPNARFHAPRMPSPVRRPPPVAAAAATAASPARPDWEDEDLVDVADVSARRGPAAGAAAKSSKGGGAAAKPRKRKATETGARTQKRVTKVARSEETAGGVAGRDRDINSDEEALDMADDENQGEAVDEGEADDRAHEMAEEEGDEDERREMAAFVVGDEDDEHDVVEDDDDVYGVPFANSPGRGGAFKRHEDLSARRRIRGGALPMVGELPSDDEEERELRKRRARALTKKQQLKAGGGRAVKAPRRRVRTEEDMDFDDGEGAAAEEEGEDDEEEDEEEGHDLVNDEEAAAEAKLTEEVARMRDEYHDPEDPAFAEADEEEERDEEERRMVGDGHELIDPRGNEMIRLIAEYQATRREETKDRKLFRLLRLLERKWTKVDGQKMFDYAHARYGLDVNDVRYHTQDYGGMLNTKYEHFHCESIALSRLFARAPWPDNHPNLRKAESIFNKINKTIYDTYMMLYFEMHAFMNMAPRPMELPPFNPLMFRRESARDLQGAHKLIHFALRRLEQLNLRKRSDRIQEQKVVDGYRTGFWQDCGTIQEWLLQQASICGNLDIWREATTHYRRVAEYLEHCFDNQFQYVLCARRVWSFKNGRYFGDDNGMFDVFVPYSQSAAFEHIASANYFDINFNSGEEVGFDWYKNDDGDIIVQNESEPITPEDLRTKRKAHPIQGWFDGIKTPAHNIIFETQKWDREVQKHYWVQYGRLLYPLGQMDQWEKFMFLLGLPKTGKSTLGKFIFNTYQVCDIGVLSNTVEEQFGLYVRVQHIYSALQACDSFLVSGSPATVLLARLLPTRVGALAVLDRFPLEFKAGPRTCSLTIFFQSVLAVNLENCWMSSVPPGVFCKRAYCTEVYGRCQPWVNWMVFRSHKVHSKWQKVQNRRARGGRLSRSSRCCWSLSFADIPVPTFEVRSMWDTWKKP